MKTHKDGLGKRKFFPFVAVRENKNLPQMGETADYSSSCSTFKAAFSLATGRHSCTR